MSIHWRVSIAIGINSFPSSVHGLTYHEDLTLAAQTILLIQFVAGCLLKLQTVEHGAPIVNHHFVGSILNHSVDAFLLLHGESTICLSTHRLSCE